MVAASKEKPAKEIIIENIGRPKKVVIPLPEDGGVVVLSGRNGAGKSTTLEAVQDAITGRKDKRSKPRDGIATGKLAGCGVTMTVSRKITTSGKLTVETLDGGRLSIADVVSPPYKGAEEADGRRIKALVQLAGVVADAELFREIHPDFDKIVQDETLSSDDILVMADKIKRDMEQAARNTEGQRDIEERHALACEESVAGIPLNVETDAGKLQLAIEDAVRRAQKLISESQEAKRRNAEILEARQKITEVTLARPGENRVSLEDAKFRETDAHNQVTDAKAEYERLEDQLRAAQRSLMRAEEKWEDAKRELSRTEHFMESVAELEKTVAAGEMIGPTDAELASADEAVTATRKAVEAGAAARRAKESLAKAESHREKQAQLAERAEGLRQAAAAVDSVLTAQIATLGSPLRVEAGRLVTETDRGPSTFYAELSEGERWKMATEIAINAVGRGGLLSVPQEAWQSIQPAVRIELDQLAKSAGVVILAAECSDEPEIVVKQFNGSPVEELETVTP